MSINKPNQGTLTNSDVNPEWRGPASSSAEIDNTNDILAKMRETADKDAAKEKKTSPQRYKEDRADSKNQYRKAIDNLNKEVTNKPIPNTDQAFYKTQVTNSTSGFEGRIYKQSRWTRTRVQEIKNNPEKNTIAQEVLSGVAKGEYNKSLPAVIGIESGYDTLAKSGSGALSIAQIMPDPTRSPILGNTIVTRLIYERGFLKALPKKVKDEKYQEYLNSGNMRKLCARITRWAKMLKRKDTSPGDRAYIDNRFAEIKSELKAYLGNPEYYKEHLQIASDYLDYLAKFSKNELKNAKKRNPQLQVEANPNSYKILAYNTGAGTLRRSIRRQVSDGVTKIDPFRTAKSIYIMKEPANYLARYHGYNEAWNNYKPSSKARVAKRKITNPKNYVSVGPRRDKTTKNPPTTYRAFVRLKIPTTNAGDVNKKIGGAKAGDEFFINNGKLYVQRKGQIILNGFVV